MARIPDDVFTLQLQTCVIAVVDAPSLGLGRARYTSISYIWTCSVQNPEGLVGRLGCRIVELGSYEAWATGLSVCCLTNTDQMARLLSLALSLALSCSLTLDVDVPHPRRLKGLGAIHPKPS